MKGLIKDQFLPSDYTIHVRKMRCNLRQKDMDVMSYTEKFHKLSIREGREDEEENIARYLNGLRFNLQDEIGLQMPRMLGECFELAIREEEKLKRK